MYAAHTLDGELVYAHHVAHHSSTKGDWFCPLCKQPMNFKISTKGKGYFSHLSACTPGYQPVKRITKESEVHLIAKKLLAHALTQAGYIVTTERYIAAIQQTADLVVSLPNATNVLEIIEFQRSPISPRQIDSRQQAYLKLTKRCIWLVDYDIFNSRKIHVWHQTMVQYSSENGFHWVSLDLNKQRIVVTHHVPALFSPYHLNLQEESIFLRDFSMECLGPELFTFLDRGNSAKKDRIDVASDVIFQKRLQQLRKQEVYQKDLQEMYSRGHLIQSLPPWILIERWQFLITRTPAWLVFAWGYFALSELRTDVFTTSDFHQKIVEIVQRKAIRLAVMPFVEMDICSRLTKVMLAKFKEKCHLIQCGSDEWQVL